MTWSFWFEGWEYLAKMTADGLLIKRALSGRPWVSAANREVTDAAIRQRPQQAQEWSL